MKITKLSTEYDYRYGIKYWVDGKEVARFLEGEPEDATISRDWNDVQKITELMRMAWEAGKNGEAFEVENVQIDFNDF